MSIIEGKLAVIIEDDPVSVKVLHQLLEEVGMFVEVMLDTKEIEQIMSELPTPDVIFLDLEMPQRNGYTVLEYFQTNPKLIKVPIVAYTTHISHLNTAKTAGFHSFLGKPLDGERFKDQLESILNNIPIWEVP